LQKTKSSVIITYRKAIMEEKSANPPYASYRSLLGHIEELKASDSHLPDVIDRSLLRRKSGSEQSALISTYRWLGLIDEAGAPTDDFHQIFRTNTDEDRQPILERLVKRSYAFVGDGTINLRNATSSQMTERFRQYGLTGSTIGRAISFFLAIAKDAGIQVSPHIKPPSAPTSAKKKKPTKQTDSWPLPGAGSPQERPPAQEESEDDDDEMVSIPIPIFGKPDARIVLPKDLSSKEWATFIKMSEFILKNYRDNIEETK
jgi:Family of unknown function (DUF5343)